MGLKIDTQPRGVDSGAQAAGGHMKPSRERVRGAIENRPKTGMFNNRRVGHDERSTPVIPAPERQRQGQEDHCEFKSSLDYIVRTHLK